MARPLIYMAAVLGLLTAPLQTMAAPDSSQGARMFGACAACHSVMSSKVATHPPPLMGWSTTRIERPLRVTILVTLLPALAAAITLATN